MNISIFSFIMAILWCNLYVTIVALVSKRDGFLLRVSFFPLLFLGVVSLFRIICSVEFPKATIIGSEVILPALYNIFSAPIFENAQGTFILLVADIFLLIWISGSIYFLLKYALQTSKLSKIFGSFNETADPRIIAIMEGIVTESGKSTSVKIVQSEHIIIPLVTGFFRPTIYLPITSFTDSELIFILKHEWTHFLHKDSWVKLFVYIVISVFWWNPFVHVLKHDLNHMLEVKCDLSVTAKMDSYNREQYLASILKVVRQLLNAKSTLVPPAHFARLIETNSKTKIAQRFHLVLDYEPGKIHRIILNSIICVLIIVSLIASYAFVVQSVYSTDDLPDGNSIMTLTPENAYLTLNEDGSYNVYYNNEFLWNVSSNNEDSLSSLPIK